MRRQALLLTLASCLVLGHTAHAETRQSFTIPIQTKIYEIRDKDGNSLTLTFSFREKEVVVVVRPSLPTDEPKVITIPLQPSEREPEQEDHVSQPTPDLNKEVFRDVRDHWAMPDILAMSIMGFLKGYPDGTFRPNNTISRAEFGALFERVMQRATPFSPVPLSRMPFRDVNSHDWFSQPVQNLLQRGIIEPRHYEQATFAPNQPIPRQEMAAWMATEVSGGTSSVTFTDEGQIRFLEQAKKLASLELIKGFPDGTFRPTAFMTRAEAATMMMRFLREKGVIVE